MVTIDGLAGAATVVRGDAVLIEAARGVEDQRTGRACTPRTRFQIASVSKQIAAAAVLLLADAQAVALDDPIARYLADDPAQWRSITLRHLLTHTSGIGHWGDLPDLDLYSPIQPEEQLSILRRARLHSWPGSAWRYSSPGYVLLARIVERASDQPYAGFLADRIFTPLGMAATSAGLVPGGSARVARGHRDGVPVPSLDLGSACVGAGDVWSTTADLALFNAALGSGALLTRRSAAAMLAIQATAPSQPVPGCDWLLEADGYGYGWYVGSLAERRACFHPGDNPGYRSLSVWLPHDRTSIVILANDDTADLASLLSQLLSAVSG